MTVGMFVTTRRRRRSWRFVAAAMTVAAIGAAGIVVFGTFGGRINVTPSEPLGLWRIEPLDRPVMPGDLIFICPPVNDVMRKARARGYLRFGLCPGGLAPLIKTVVAVGGQRVDIGADIRVDGEALPHSRLAVRDGAGRKLQPFASGIVPVGHVFLFSSFAGSYDSRYFGPLPLSGMLGRAREVVTYAP
ncbi:conjugative transfer signal peptidase TraF [Ensifer sp. ENS11]|nr:conjugative transfer signal peptidase TraF [Ensifer sp. ENS11]